MTETEMKLPFPCDLVFWGNANVCVCVCVWGNANLCGVCVSGVMLTCVVCVYVCVLGNANLCVCVHACTHVSVHFLSPTILL